MSRRRHGSGGTHGRLFPLLPPAPALQPDELEAIRELIIDRPSENDTIPAGFTYLAQFVDHDLTFDPTPSGRRNDGAINLRTPRLDLDSLYGAGPIDQPYLYEGAKLVIGGTDAVPDLPRLDKKAIIGDPRNDEHLLLAQMHLLFMRFHNAVTAREPDFAEAQRIVRWHYQWIVLHDFLDRILGEVVAKQVRARRRFFAGAVVPVEFSGAAYRFAHSMVRHDYRLNASSGLNGHPIFPDLAGSRPLDASLQVQWPRFFGAGDAVIKSRLIGPRLAASLRALPDGLDARHRGLDLLDLLRAQSLGLPSGLDVARAMGERALTAAELGGIEHPPLWYYVLAEARALGDGGRHLGPVGGRIVGEVLVGLVASDPTSYLCRWPGWRPTLAERDDFTMVDLVNFTR